MSQPPAPYFRVFSFETFSTANPNQPLPGVQVDNELNLVSQSLAATISRLNELQRADGKLRGDALDNTEIINTAKLAAYQATMAMLQDSIDSVVASATSAAQSAESSENSYQAAIVARNAAITAASNASVSASEAQQQAQQAAQSREDAATESSLAAASAGMASNAAAAAEQSAADADVSAVLALSIRTYLDSEYFEVMQKWRNLDDVENKHQAREHLGVQGDVSHAALYHEFKTTLRYYRPPQADAEIDDADQLLRKWFGLEFNVTTEQFDSTPDFYNVIFDPVYGPFNWNTNVGPIDWNRQYPNVTWDMTRDQRVDILRARLRSFGVVMTNSMLFLRNEMQGAVRWATSRKIENQQGQITNVDWPSVYGGSFQPFNWEGNGPPSIFVPANMNRFVTLEDFAQATPLIPNGNDGYMLPYVADYVGAKAQHAINSAISQDIIDGLNAANPAISYFNPVATQSSIVDSVRPLIRAKVPAAINWIGAYDGNTTYNVGDGVSFNGEWYVARDVFDPTGGEYAPISGQPDVNPDLWTKLIPAGVGGAVGDFLPLSGGTMTGNISWSGGGQYIGQGLDDFGIGGYGGLSLVCSVGYDINWQAGWLTAYEQDRTTPRPLYLNSAYGSPLRSWDYWNNSGVEVSHTGITFADNTTQTTAASPFDPTGYATESWVEAQGYLVSSDLAGYATESWVTGLGYITSAALAPYETTSHAASTYYPLSNPSGYITNAALAGYLTSATAAATYQVKPTVAGTDGQIFAWDAATSLPVWIDNAARTLFATVRNETGSTLTPGTVVYISGASGNKPLVTKAQANSEATSSRTFAVISTTIATNNNGTAIVAGELGKLDTSAYAEGATLYLSPTTAGALTTTKPSAPNHLVYVATVTRSHANQGTIEVRIANGFEVSELHDAAISSPTNNDLFVYESATSLWKNKSFATLDLLTGTTAAATYYPLTNPSGYITSSALSGYATQSWVTSQDYITSAALSPYLTSATASATYFPKPTGTTAQYLRGDGTTSTFATDALAAVPDASTSTKGKVQLATNAEAIAGTDTTKAVTSAGVATEASRRFARRRFQTPITVLTTQTNGTGAGYTQVQQYTNIFAGTAGNAGFARGYSVATQPEFQAGFDWSRPIGFGAFFAICNFSSYAGTNVRCGLGYSSTPTAGVAVGDLSARGIGFYWAHGGNLFLQVHDGTTLRNIDTGYTPSSSNIVQKLYAEGFSDGAGNVTAYVRVTNSSGSGASISEYTATSANGPTGALAVSPNNGYLFQVVSTTAHSAQLNVGGLHPTFFYD